MEPIPQEQANGAGFRASDEDVRELFKHIAEDLKNMAQDEVRLARLELMDNIKAPATDLGAIVFGGVLALIALGLLCTTVVVALAPAIPALWLRMLIMSGVYLAMGAMVAGFFAQRLRRDLPPLPLRAMREARRT